MKSYLLFSTLVICTLFFSTPACYSQGLGVNTDGTAADPSAMLDVKATNKGVLVPRLTSTANVTSPVTGLLIYQTNAPAGFYYYDGATWLLLQNSGNIIAASNGGAGSVNGILKADGSGTVSAAVAGTDYLTPDGSAAALTGFPTFNQSTTGSAATLTTPRNINGIAFDGSADITLPADAGTLTGTTLSSGVTGSSLTSVGTLSNLTVTNPIAGSTTGNEAPLTFNSPLARSSNAISIPLATTTADGYVSSTDWNTFNGKQSAITLTTTGTSGAATLTGTTLNVPQYTGGSGTVTTVTSANTDISVATTTTPVLTLNSGTGANKIVKLDASGKLPGVDGSALTSLNAASLNTGTIPSLAMPGYTGEVTATFGTNVLAIANTFNGGNHIVSAINTGSGGINVSQLAASGILPVENGAALTSLNATNLSSGTVPVARLASSGTASATTFLNGLGAWATPSAFAMGATFTANGTISGASTNVIYLVNDGKTVTLPSASVAGQILILYDNQSVFAGISVSCPAATTISDVNNSVFNASGIVGYGVFRLLSDGAGHWFVW